MINIAGLEPTSLAVVVLNWNCADDTRKAVTGLPETWRERIFVVDNGSKDWEAQREILSTLSGVKVVRRSLNGGYAAGMNTGMLAASAAGFRYAALLNADARPNEDALVRMLGLAREHAVVGIAQTQGIDESATRDRYVTAAVGRNLTPRPLECSGCLAGFHQADVVSGAVLVVDMDAIAEVSWMDESFFHYKEEFDLAYRIRSSGHKIAWICDREVPHAVGASMPHHSGNACYYTARNEILFFRKHRGLIRSLLNPRLARNELVFLGLSARHRKLGHWAAGVRDGLVGRTGERGGDE